MPGHASGGVAVWSPAVRVLHWALATGFIASYLTRHSRGNWHEWIGYAVLAAVVARIYLGLNGPGNARFSSFVRGPSVAWGYCKALSVGTERRYLGHNPLGGYMVLALLAASLTICMSGWLFTTDRFWGVEWVAKLHLVLTNICIILILLHLFGVIVTSIRKRENLAGAMLHGRKRPPGPGDIP